MVFENLYGGSVMGRTLEKAPVKANSKTPAVVASHSERAPLSSPTLANTFGEMETSTDLYFAGELTVPGKLAVAAPHEAAALSRPGPGLTSVTAVPKPVATPERSPEEPYELDIDLADSLVLREDGFGSLTFKVLDQATTSVQVERYEPIEPGPGASIGIASELNRRSEGLQIEGPSFSGEPTIATSIPRPARELSRAVKLTREAVYAWVNVFTGPALVTVSQSNEGPFER
jgi:hypothetical protein